MEYIKDTLEFAIAEPSVISLGKFDGLHTGHRYLLEAMEQGQREGLKSIAFTFDIPPGVVGREPHRVLSTNAEKVGIFQAAGVDYLIECPFTDQLRRMSPYEFLEMLTGKINIKKIVAGTDFRFGHRRSGSYEDLRAHAGQFGYEAVIVQKKQYKGEDISSTRIRDRILAGDLEEANHLLGYTYFLSAPVIHGNEIGRTIGIPTANQLPAAEKLLPPNGVYAVEVSFDGQIRHGISNIGCKPTIHGQNPLGVETYLFDFAGDLYGKELKVSFLKFIRRERRFASLEELREQMDRDIAACREIMNCREKREIIKETE